MYFYEDYRLVLCSQQAFMMAVTGMRFGSGISLAVPCQAAKFTVETRHMSCSRPYATLFPESEEEATSSHRQGWLLRVQS